MMLLTSRERRLCYVLRDLPHEHKYRYTKYASQSLQRALFNSLVAENDDYLRILFGGKVPKAEEDWDLRNAQGMVEGSEYSEAARGKACGHIFKNGDATYRCKTCTTDETCVLCTRCFEASEHTGHLVSQHISTGNSGCCDCGDDEAWKLPVKCAIHTADSSATAGKQRQAPTVPEELVESIKMTIGRAMDYLCDVISCSPENLRLEKKEDIIRQDERQSYLNSKWYEESEDPDPEFALLLWNDEKHTVDEVQQQVARACKATKKFGLEKAIETNDMGRSVVNYSRDLNSLLKVAKIIEHIKITVTIRSSRDTFREQMCGTIIEWLGNIAGCSVGEDHDILRYTLCEELLKTWRTGSVAFNKWVGMSGLDDHEIVESAYISEAVASSAARRGGVLITGRFGVPHLDSDSDALTNDMDNEDGDEDGESQANDEDMDLDTEQMDLDVMAAELDVGNNDTDHDMRDPGEMEDETEVSEATYAGYPPPPPPPPALPQQVLPRHPLRAFSTDSNIGNEPTLTIPLVSRATFEIPPTPWSLRKKSPSRPPAYWLEQPEGYASKEPVPLHEDLRQRVRLDWLLLFDLRLWKIARISLRDLYISTVVSIPQFKRVLGLRFAGLYTLLAQLYLIADREPDHSIVNLSVQMLTTPSIAEELVERANVLTNLFATLYTFLTHRQVGHPWDVAIHETLAFDAGSVANRRMYHFFGDLKHLFDVDSVQKKFRTQERYVFQFLDLIRLPQGICPNVRAVGDHVEYENDVWIGASLMTKEINRLCRQFAESFRWRDDEDNSSLARVIRTVAKATVVNSVGGERLRFDQAEIKAETRFKTLDPYYFENGPSSFDNNVNDFEIRHTVVDFVVEAEPISFHHALHYTLSWLIDVGKKKPEQDMRSLLQFTVKELKEPPPYKALIPDHDPETYLMALFDFPLRVCAWLAQMKTSMWVRNGLSLRHQMGTYRGVSLRDFGHHRDIFLLQTAMVICNPSRVLASIIDRFGMDDWMRGNYITRVGYEPSQQLDVSEDFIHLLIVLLSDRTSLQPVEGDKNAQALAIRRDIAHILCFKPLSFSDLNSRLGLTDRSTDLEDFREILEEMTNYRAPEGLSDSGSFELKREHLSDIDPYTAHYTKNQRDEAEHAYRVWMAKRSGKPEAEIVLEPKLRPIHSGIFSNLSTFTKTPLFSQIIYYSLAHHSHPRLSSQLPNTRIEAYLQVVLHLILAAVLEDDTSDDSEPDVIDQSSSFIFNVLQKSSELGSTIFDILVKMLESDDIKGCHPKIRLILHRIQQRKPRIYDTVVSSLYSKGRNPPSLPLDRLGFESPRTPLDGDQEARERQSRELRKQQALDRQARVMAQFQQQQQNFLNNQDVTEWGDVDADELDSIVTGSAEEHKKIWKYPTGTCILCQEETNDTRLFGTFALLANSNIFRQTDIQDPDFVGEALSTPTSLDRAADSIRPFGVASQNCRKVTKLTPSGSEVVSEHQGLGRGFPSSFASRGPVSVGCGHIMHYSCFDLYCSATLRRQHHQIARNHPERVPRKEFVCPLCKALGNTFLPIIWRGKEETYPGALNTDNAFHGWLSSGVGLTVSRFYKREESRSGSNCHQELFVSYTSEAVIPPLGSKLTALFQTPLTSPTTPQESSRNSMPGLFPPDENSNLSMVSSSYPFPTDVVQIDELISIYNRLRETIKANELPSRFPYSSDQLGRSIEDLGNIDTLAKAFGNTISATEIAQRGVQSQPGSTLLEKISPSIVTHLRILSETTSSYIAIGGMRNAGTSTPAREFLETTRRQLLQLFVGHPQISGDEPENVIKTQLPSALSQDSFVFLAECSVFLVPAFGLNIHHIVRLCYLLEIVKVALHLTAYPSTLEEWRFRTDTPIEGNISPEAFHSLQDFLMQIRLRSTPPWPVPMQNRADEGSVMNDDRIQKDLVVLHKAIAAYSLAFLRKAAILLNVRYGVDYPDTGLADVDEPELDRLTKVLNLPSLVSMLASIRDNASNQLSIQDSIIAGWVQHWQCHEGHHVAMRGHPILHSSHYELLKQSAYQSLRPGHPAIFELIGLPKQFDTLIYEVSRRRCPTTGKRLEDPALCLFCGDIFCSQASCCHKNGKGGCNQHMQKCGIDTGLFLNIRKCCVLYLHNKDGSFNPAPYLDRYGEPDAGLRRGRQLFLNQKRYDSLYRSVWLQQGIPTMIARKLEADINNGGWETM
ncbi:MAG: hypothetical protein Q9175_002341 [Cornicularia normoerica]